MTESNLFTPEQQALHIKVNSLFDELYLLAANVAEHSDSVIPSSLHKAMAELSERFQDLGKVIFTFTGEGFIPTFLPDGDEETIYSQLDAVTGTFEQLTLADEEVVDYVTSDEIEAEAEEDSGSLLQEDEIRKAFMSQLLTPPAGLQLFAEFLLDMNTTESEVGGSSIRASQIAYYGIMTASKIRLDAVDFEKHDGLLGVDDVEDFLQSSSRRMREILKDTAFRRKSGLQQHVIIEQMLERINDTVQIDRFAAIIPCNSVWSHVVANENKQFVETDMPSYMSAFSFQPIRIDVLENFGLTDGLRIVNDSSMVSPDNVGCYLVGEISEELQIILGVPSQVIWLPIKYPRKKRGEIIEQGFAAYFEEA